jgi:hypothetical protein
VEGKLPARSAKQDPRSKTEAESTVVAIGFRSKTGRAIAVVLTGPRDAPEVVLRQDVVLSDPELPVSLQPYHSVMDVPWEDADRKLKRVLRAIQRVSFGEVSGIVADLRTSGASIRGVGIVGGSAHDPARIGNPHVRAHAAEGQLFRRVLEEGAAAVGLPWVSFAEAELNGAAADLLGRSAAILATQLTAMGRMGIRPWRADEKAAALAAWIVLARGTIRAGQ